MISNDLQDIVEKLCAQGVTKLLDAVTEEQIAAFEKENDVTLPGKYRDWLLFSDGGELFLPAGVQLYGIEHNPVIDVSEHDGPDDSYVVIGTLASGDPIVFRKTEERISIYNREGGRIEEDETYENFYCFLKDIYNILGI